MLPQCLPSETVQKAVPQNGSAVLSGQSQVFLPQECLSGFKQQLAKYESWHCEPNCSFNKNV